jgi:hypothetical protein
MTTPTLDEVRSILEDFELRMRMILEGAWEDWQSMPDRAVFSARTRASAVFDFIRKRAIAEFDGDPNIRIMPEGQTVKFLFRDRALVRFKKANPRGLGSTIETQAVIEFVDPQIPLFELPPIFHVEVCYHLNKLATEMASLAVTARQRNTKLWAYELRRSRLPDVVPLPTAPQPEGAPPEVRPRQPVSTPEKKRGE